MLVRPEHWRYLCCHRIYLDGYLFSCLRSFFLKSYPCDSILKFMASDFILSRWNFRWPYIPRLRRLCMIWFHWHVLTYLEPMWSSLSGASDLWASLFAIRYLLLPYSPSHSRALACARVQSFFVWIRQELVFQSNSYRTCYFIVLYWLLVLSFSRYF